MHEVFFNLKVLEDPKFQSGGTTGDYRVDPRVMLDVTNTVLAPGSFAHGDDEQLLKLLFGWLEIGAQFNRRLEITEQFRSGKSIQLAVFLGSVCHLRNAF